MLYVLFGFEGITMLACHCSSGLGNQMNSYAEFLAYQKLNPDQQCYIETINYELEQDAISMWNGYELGRIFGINGPFLSDLFTSEQWDAIINEVQMSHFWANGNWDYGPVFVKAFEKQGLKMVNLCERRGWAEPSKNNKSNGREKARAFIKNIFGSKAILLRNLYWKYKLSMQRVNQFGIIPGDGNYLCGGFGKYMYRNSGMRFVEKEVRSAFSFKKMEDRKNIEVQTQMKNCNSVSIHVRRGDMLSSNADFFKYGYYKKAVRYIRKHVKSPFFFFFCIPGDTQWCKDNIALFDVNLNMDRVCFVNWNSGLDSYKDMQLMASCKHNIITRTSFGWWGSYLNPNPNKITISPDILFDTTVTIS